MLQELNRRRAVVYSHPAPVVIGKHDFPREEETTRNIYSVLNDAPPKYPNIIWMFSHAGGTMPMIIQRIVGRETAATLDQPAPPNAVVHAASATPRNDESRANGRATTDELARTFGTEHAEHAEQTKSLRTLRSLR